MGRENEKVAADLLDDAGWGVVPPEQYLIDLEPEFLSLWKRVFPYTMTSVERGYALFQSVRHVINNDIAGSFVECGVWKGGSCMLIALTLASMGVTDREIYLYDTFTGMTEPTDADRIAWNGRSVRERFERFASWAVDLSEVSANLEATGYPLELLRYVEGDVLETLERELPGTIALLRLDTDWYESTVKELEILYPLLNAGGLLLLDDYGHFEGARKAVDEYFVVHPAPFFARVDYTGRVAVKTI